jgi:hypothetical protein
MGIESIITKMFAKSTSVISYRGSKDVNHISAVLESLYRQNKIYEGSIPLAFCKNIFPSEVSSQI